MKRYLIITLLLLSSLSFAQSKLVKLSEAKIGPLNCEYTHRINMETGDTIKYVYIGFRNQKYKQLIEYKSVLFSATDTEQLTQFIKDLNSALPEMGSKTHITWERDTFTLTLYDFSQWLYLYTPDSGAHTIITKGQAQNLIIWLKGNGF